MGSPMIAREARVAQGVVRAIEEPLAGAVGAPASIAVPAHQRFDQEHLLDACLVLAVDLQLVLVRQRAPRAAPSC